jgi:hypothetical protein
MGCWVLKGMGSRFKKPTKTPTALEKGAWGFLLEIEELMEKVKDALK